MPGSPARGMELLMLTRDLLTREHLSAWKRAVLDSLHAGVVSGVAEREEGERRRHPSTGHNIGSILQTENHPFIWTSLFIKLIWCVTRVKLVELNITLEEIKLPDSSWSTTPCRDSRGVNHAMEIWRSGRAEPSQTMFTMGGDVPGRDMGCWILDRLVGQSCGTRSRDDWPILVYMLSKLKIQRKPMKSIFQSTSMLHQYFSMYSTPRNWLTLEDSG